MFEALNLRVKETEPRRRCANWTGTGSRDVRKQNRQSGRRAAGMEALCSAAVSSVAGPAECVHADLTQSAEPLCTVQMLLEPFQPFVPHVPVLTAVVCTCSGVASSHSCTFNLFKYTFSYRKLVPAFVLNLPTGLFSANGHHANMLHANVGHAKAGSSERTQQVC